MSQHKLSTRFKRFYTSISLHLWLSFFIPSLSMGCWGDLFKDTSVQPLALPDDPSEANSQQQEGADVSDSGEQGNSDHAAIDRDDPNPLTNDPVDGEDEEEDDDDEEEDDDNPEDDDDHPAGAGDEDDDAADDEDPPATDDDDDDDDDPEDPPAAADDEAQHAAAQAAKKLKKKRAEEAKKLLADEEANKLAEEEAKNLAAAKAPDPATPKAPQLCYFCDEELNVNIIVLNPNGQEYIKCKCNGLNEIPGKRY